MNIPTSSSQGSAASADYQSLYAAPRAGKSTFAQTIAQTQSSWLSLTTAEGDLVTLSDLSLSYQQTQGVGWFTPASSGVKLAGSATTAEAMGLSVQGDLNAQELADVTRLVTELTSIASAFFSGDYQSAMTEAMDFGDLGMGSVSSLAASFSSHTVTQTRITSHHTLPAMADLSGLSLQDLYQALGADQAEKMNYAELLEARWQQMLKALDAVQEKELEGIPPVVVDEALPAEALSPSSPPAEEQQPPPVSQEAEPVDATAAFLPAEERAARQMVAQLEELFTKHPKLTPFAKALAGTAMEKAAGRTEQTRPDTAKAFGALQNAFRRRLHQWFLPPTAPAAAKPLTAV